jgi:deoxyadenosine/deoxycytidine kinase
MDMRLRVALEVQRSGENWVLDRTIYEDAEIFAPSLASMGLLAEREYTTVRNLFDLTADLVQPPDLMIYLQGSIAALVAQIASRGRDYEDALSIEYLRQLNNRYDEWYENYQRGPKILIPIDQYNFAENNTHLGEILNKVNAELFGLFGGNKVAN